MKRIITLFVFICLLMLCFAFSVYAEETEIPLLTHDQLSDYKRIYEPEMKSWDTYGKNLIKIETVIGQVFDTDFGYDFILWIKDSEGYFPDKHHVTSYDKASVFPFKPKYGERIIYTLKPTAYGTVYGEAIQSYDILEENADVDSIIEEYIANNTIPYEDLIQYKKLYEPNLSDSFAGDTSVKLEVVIGDITNISDYGFFTDYDYDMWIRGKDKYYRVSMFSTDEQPISGQRQIITVTPYGDGHFYPDQIHEYDTLIIGEADLNEIKNNGIETDKNRIFLGKEFNAEDFEEIAYKKLLRKPKDYYDHPIKIEGTYQQTINSMNSLMLDKNQNIYHLTITPGLIDYNLLEDDRIIVYGYVAEKYYNYTTILGKESTVPSIFVKSIELLEEE